MIKTLLQSIFSVKNEYRDIFKIKVFTILGIKIKFKNINKNKLQESLLKQSKQIKMFSKKLEQLNTSLKKQKDKLKQQNDRIKVIQNRANLLYVKENYKIVLNKIRKKFKQNEKIRVVFLVNENQKWTYQSLYDEFEKSKYFEPLVLVTLLSITATGVDTTRNNLEDNYDFFKKRGMNVEYAYKNSEYVDLQIFSPDIIFYTQPGEIADIQNIVHVSHFALTMYCPYGYQTFNYENNYLQTFHRLLFIYFVENIYNISRFEKYGIANSKNCISLGYPKLDVYTKNCNIDLNKYWKEPNKFKIIYAPHHSFGQKVTTNIGTFLSNYSFILNLAKAHPETTWIYKPHNTLKYVLTIKNNYMTSEEYDNYCKQWESIGNIYNEGDYFDIFQTSDLMITDCASFLTEYLPSKKPLIRLSKHDCIKMNDYGEKIISEYYYTYSNEELEKTFNMLVVDRNDPKKEAREKLAEEVFDYKEPAATKIYNYILERLRGEDD